MWESLGCEFLPPLKILVFLALQAGRLQTGYCEPSWKALRIWKSIKPNFGRYLFQHFPACVLRQLLSVLCGMLFYSRYCKLDYCNVPFISEQSVWTMTSKGLLSKFSLGISLLIFEFRISFFLSKVNPQGILHRFSSIQRPETQPRDLGLSWGRCLFCRGLVLLHPRGGAHYKGVTNIFSRINNKMQFILSQRGQPSQVLRTHTPPLSNTFLCFAIISCNHDWNV